VPIPAPAKKKTTAAKKKTTATKKQPAPVVTEQNTVEVSVCVRDNCHRLAQLNTEENGGYAKKGNLLFGVGCSNCDTQQLQPSGKEPVYLCKHLNNKQVCSFALCCKCYQIKSTDGSESTGRSRKRKTLD
jgi:uncharacterized protein YaaQ